MPTESSRLAKVETAVALAQYQLNDIRGTLKDLESRLDGADKATQADVVSLRERVTALEAVMQELRTVTDEVRNGEERFLFIPLRLLQSIDTPKKAAAIAIFFTVLFGLLVAVAKLAPELLQLIFN